MNRSVVALVVLCAALLSGCTETSMDRLYVLDTKASDERPGTYLGLPLESGQIVLSEAGNPYSMLFSLCTEAYFDFTHAAVLVMEDGKPWIYEMTGEYKPGFDDRPTDGIEGGCRRIGLEEYARAYLYLEVFDPPAGVDPAKMVEWIKARYVEQVPFDPYFQYGEHEALFCTEFVQLALEAGGAQAVKLAAVRQQPSMQRLLEWLEVDQAQGLPAGILADSERSVGALGQLPSLKAARGYFAAKREVHRRFTPDQQLGNLFRMEGFGELALRLNILRFLTGAASLIHDLEETPTDEEVEAKVRALAADWFGVAPRADSE